MKKMAWISLRDFSSYFFRPLGWILISGVLFLSGWFFAEKMEVEASTGLMRTVLVFVENLSLLVVPLIAMDSLAGERVSGTLETLMTSPVREIDIVLGKFFAGWSFYLVLLLPTMYYALILNQYGPVDFGQVFTGYAGMAFSGAFFLGIGILFSSLCPRPFYAAVFSLLVLFALRLIPTFLLAMDPGTVRDVLLFLNYRPHLSTFRMGIIDTRDLVYFLSGTILFLLTAAQVLHAGRSR